jgi:hypothetical protein
MHSLAADLEAHSWYLALVRELLEEIDAYLARLAELEAALAAVGD